MDWPGLLRAGLRGLGLRPDEFWNLTPNELRIMLGADETPSLTRAGLDRLLAAFPDGRKETCDGTNRGSAGADRGT